MNVEIAGVSANDLDQIGEVTLSSARAGAAELMRLFGKAKISEKGPRDLVTEADIASQNAIRDLITESFPEHLFVGEEGGNTADADGNPMTIEQIRERQQRQICWIVDPLDGTTNYAHGMHAFAVSVAAVYQGKVLSGAILDPSTDEMFAAVVGRGATLNGQPIVASDCADLNQALIAASFAAQVEPNSSSVKRFVHMLNYCQAIRRLGSAALNLCYVASGRLDGYWADSVKPWDIAAGFLIVRESQGVMEHISQGEVDLWNPRFIACGNQTLYDAMHQVLNEAVT